MSSRLVYDKATRTIVRESDLGRASPSTAVVANIKSIVARCVCGAEDYPYVDRVSSYRQAYRITCDACGRMLYAPTHTEALIDWERIGAKTFNTQEVAELTDNLSTKDTEDDFDLVSSYAAGRLDGWSSAQTEIDALKLALDACVDSASAADKTQAALLAGVNKVLALLYDEADADMDSTGKYHPNTAMRIAQELRAALAKAKG